MTTITNGITGEKLDVIIVKEEDLSSACMWFDSFVEEKTCQRYQIYRDCVDHCFYAVAEEE